jgi:hypothetical protein
MAMGRHSDYARHWSMIGVRVFTLLSWWPSRHAVVIVVTVCCPHAERLLTLGGCVMEGDLTGQIRALMATFQRAEAHAKEMLEAARAQGLSFGLDYNHLDDDIAHLLGRLRYMERIAQRHHATQRDET